MSGRLLGGLDQKEQGFLDFLSSVCCFSVRMSSSGCLVYGEGRGSDELAPAGVCGWPLRMGLCVGFTRLAARPLPHGFQSQVHR